MHMKLSFCFLLVLIFGTVSYSQVKKEYATLIEEAVKQYENKKYAEAGFTYSEAFMGRGDKGEINDRYNAACAYALGHLPDSAFKQLQRIATLGKFTRIEQLEQDSDLITLHTDVRWKEITEAVKENKAMAEKSLDKALAATLDSVFNEDQDYRRELKHIEKKYGRNSDEMKQHWKIIAQKDSTNLLLITDILDKRGWPGPDVAGTRGNQTIFLVIQHSDLKTQEKYLPMMQAAVAKGDAMPSSLALLEDRVALRQGKRQRYGSQISQNTMTGNYYVQPLEDPEHVNERRTSVGLEPLESYLKNWDLRWDAEAYIKELPSIEAYEKERSSKK